MIVSDKNSNRKSPFNRIIKLHNNIENTRSLSNRTIHKDRPDDLPKNNSIFKTKRGSLTNQMDMMNKMNQLHQSNLTRGVSLSKLLADPSNTKGRSNMLNKNLHIKSSISKKLLKAFKVSKNGKS
jgi:hypothetical protein